MIPPRKISCSILFLLTVCALLTGCETIAYKAPNLATVTEPPAVLENPHKGDGWVSIEKVNGVAVLNEDYSRFELPAGPVTLDIFGAVKKGQELLHRRFVFTARSGRTYVFRYETLRPGTNDTWKTAPLSWRAWIEDKATGLAVPVDHVPFAPRSGGSSDNAQSVGTIKTN